MITSFKPITQVPDGCWVACLAGLTDIPHQALINCVRSEEKWIEYHDGVVALLAEHGWAYVMTGAAPPRGYAIGLGYSPRGFYHAVIVHDGILVWDPHPERTGVKAIEQYEALVRIVPRPR